MKAHPKAKKQKKPVAPKAIHAAAAVTPSAELPDIEYVEQLLAASAAEDANEQVTDVVADDAAVETVMSEPEVAHAAGPDAVDANGVFSLPAQCLLRDAADCKQQLLNYLNCDSVTIDVNAVERIDTAYLQVLLSFVRSRTSQSGEQPAVTWSHVGPVMAEAAKILGLQAALGLPELSEAA